MEEAKAMAQHQQQQQQQQQQQLLLHHHQQQQQRHHLLQQQQMLLLQKQQQQQAATPSNIDPHLRSQGLLHRPDQQSPNPNPNPLSHVNPNLPQKETRGNNQAELQMAYQDAWRICNPDFKRPFTSLEDACERLLPYHVVADFEAEEDDKILNSDTTGQIPSRSQQWDHNIAAKVSEFTATFEKQVLAFNMITRKRDLGEFRSEERLMVEQALLQDEKRAMLDLRAQIEKAERDAQAANFQMAAMAMAGRARAESQVHAEMMVRASAMRSQGSAQMGHEMVNGWGNTAHRDEKEATEDFLNDEEPESSMQGNWREVGKFDLNTR